MSRYNEDPICGPCQVAVGDEIARQAERGPTCRYEGCFARICAQSARVSAPRWRGLCEEHYDEQRMRQSQSAVVARSKIVPVPAQTAVAV